MQFQHARPVTLKRADIIQMQEDSNVSYLISALNRAATIKVPTIQGQSIKYSNQINIHCKITER